MCNGTLLYNVQRSLHFYPHIHGGETPHGNTITPNPPLYVRIIYDMNNLVFIKTKFTAGQSVVRVKGNIYRGYYYGGVCGLVVLKKFTSTCEHEKFLVLQRRDRKGFLCDVVGTELVMSGSVVGDFIIVELVMS